MITDAEGMKGTEGFPRVAEPRRFAPTSVAGYALLPPCTTIRGLKWGPSFAWPHTPRGQGISISSMGSPACLSRAYNCLQATSLFPQCLKATSAQCRPDGRHLMIRGLYLEN